MEFLDAAAILLVLAAGFGIVNDRVLKLPFTIGLLVGGLLASFCVLLLDAVVPSWTLADTVRQAVLGIDFADTVLNGMLSVLLFAGSLHTDLRLLKERFAMIATLASLSVVITGALAGLAAYGLFNAVGVPIDLVWCLAFGALISPTDPIAVVGIMKDSNAPASIKAKVIGESLFNDGSGVVAFTVLVGIGVATGSGATPSEAGGAHIAALLLQEVGGGLGLGIAAGYVCYRALLLLDEPNLEVLITIATVLTVGALSTRLHVSGPLAAVAAGLFVGHRGRADAMSAKVQQSVDVVWTFVDEALNAVLFLLIGLEVFAIDYSRTHYLLAAAGLIPAVLVARFAGVAAPVWMFRLRTPVERGTIRILTWGGLKGGVSVALAMKLPEFDGRSAILTVTYAIVIFSIIGQGLTVGRLIQRLYPGSSKNGVAADTTMMVH